MTIRAIVTGLPLCIAAAPALAQVQCGDTITPRGAAPCGSSMRSVSPAIVSAELNPLQTRSSVITTRVITHCLPDGFTECEVLSEWTLGTLSSGLRLEGTYGRSEYWYAESWKFHVKDDVGTWSGSCEKDAMSDEIKCYVSNFENRLLISLKEGRPNIIQVIGHDFPGSRGTIRR
jgi:hypothetical protein